MGLLLQVIWQLRILFSIAVILSVIPGSLGFSVHVSSELSSFIPPIDAQAPSSVIQPGLLPNGSILHPPVVSPQIKSAPPQQQTLNGSPPMVSPSESMVPPTEQPQHDSSPTPSTEPPHGLAPSRATEPSHDSTPPLVSSQPPSAKPPFLASPPLTTEPPPPFLTSPPPTAEPPPPFLTSPPPTAEPPPPFVVSPLPTAGPPPPFVASSPLMLPLPVEPPPPFIASPPLTTEPPSSILASPPVTAEPPPPFLASPPLTAEPPPPFLASPLPTTEPPPPFVASPPLMLPLPAKPSPFVVVSSPPETEPPHSSTLPLAAKPPETVSPLPVAGPLQSSTVGPPLSSQPHAMSPGPPHSSDIGPVSVPPNASSPLPQPVPSHASPPNFIVPSHPLVPPPLMVPPPMEPPPPFLASSPLTAESPPPFLASPLLTSEPPPPFLASLPPTAGPPPPFLASPPPTAEPPPPFLASPPLTASPPPPFLASPPSTAEPPPPFLASPPLTVEPPPPFLASPPLMVEPPPPFLASPPLTAEPPPPILASPPLTVEPPPPPFLASPPLTVEPPPPFLATPPLTVEPPPPFLATPPLTVEPPPPFLASPPPSAVPPHALDTQSPPMPPHESSPLPQPAPPHTSPATTSVPPPLARPSPALSASPPIELPHTYPPPSSTMPGALPPHASSPPPLLEPPHAPPPLSMPSPNAVPPPHDLSASPPSPAMEGNVSALPPHASQGKETHNGALPPMPLPSSPEPSPSSRTSSGGVPPVHHVMPGSYPPISHQIETPKHGAPNASGSVPNIVPSEPKHERWNGTASAPLTSLVHPPPSVGSYYSPHHSPVKGSPPFTSPSIHKSTVPSSFAPIPAVLPPRSNASEGSQSSASSPSASIHKHIHPRDKVNSPGPSSDLIPPPAPSQQGQAEIPVPAYAPKSMSAGRQKYHRRPPLSQGISPAPSPLLRAPAGHFGIPFLSPKISPSGSSTRNKKRSVAPPIRALPPPPPNQDCAYLTCPEPFTNTPPGSPCGCVWPMQVGLRLSVALYTFFPLVSELAREIAAGVFMKQSQVRVMGANATSQSPEKTIVLVDLVPLDDKFDNVTASLTTQRFWRKQVSIDKSIFGDYDVLYVHYPGLPPSPPMAPADIAVINSMPYSVGDPNGNKMHPLGVDVPKQSNKHKLNGILIAVIVFSATIGVLICCAVAWVLIFRHTSHNSQTAQTPRALTSLARSSGPMGHSTGSGPSSSLSFGSSLAPYTGSAKTFSATEIEKATDNLNPTRTLGEGGFGLVYSGVLEDETSVAVKVLKRVDQQGGREFLAEVEMLSRLHHRNLVKLIGICTDERVRCLVYELIPNGSVESHLHGTDKETAPLDWASRLKIALGAARGLAYLHEDSSPRVIHRDFKSSNILLENDFTPKVSDFGLARTAMDEENRHISTRVMGTFGYVAPEYAMTGHLLVKSDVYSYGVVLLELLTGRKPVDMSQPPGQENLVNWSRPLLTSKEGLESIIDPSLGSDISYESVAKVAAIASMCVQPEVSHRPFMGEVVQALKLVCNECDESKDGNDSRSHSRENLSMDYFDAKVGPLLGEIPNPIQTQDPLHGYLPGDDVEKGLSVSEVFSVSARLGGRQASGSFRRHSTSGPLRTARGPRFWQRVRRPSQQGSMSEHGIMYRLWASSH